MGKQIIELHPISREKLLERIKFREPEIQGAEYVDAYTNATRHGRLDRIASYHGGYTENPIALILAENALKQFELQVALYLIENEDVYIEIILGSATPHTGKKRALTRERLIDDLVRLCSKINADVQNNDYGEKNLFNVFAYLLLTQRQLKERAEALSRKRKKFGEHGRF